jgi:hypothetical protein
LNNEADDKKHENFIQLKVTHLDETANQTKRPHGNGGNADLE